MRHGKEGEMQPRGFVALKNRSLPRPLTESYNSAGFFLLFILFTQRLFVWIFFFVLQVFSAPMGQIMDRLQAFGEFEVTLLFLH